MKILLIEDDEYKAKQLTEFLLHNYNVTGDSLIIRRAYQSGMEAIMNNPIDLILLDMSMPSFEVMPLRSSGRHRSYGGRDILEEMKRKNYLIPTIVVTQFSIFGEGDEQMNENQLDNLLKKEFIGMYLGMVHYNASMLDWKDNLIKMIITSGVMIK